MKTNQMRYTETVVLSTLKPQLFVIDMINGFCKEGALADKGIMAITAPIIDLLNHIDAKDTTFIVDTHQVNDLEFKVFPPHCLKESAEAEIIEELQAYVKTPIVEKNTTNAFHQLMKDKHRHLLERKDIDSYILCGCCTDICVMQFALSLRTWLNATGQDRRILIPVNGIETFDAPDHIASQKNDAACALMKEAGIEIVKEIIPGRNEQ